MSKRKSKKIDKSLLNRLGWPRRPSAEPEALFRQVDTLISQGRANEAVALLEPLRGAYSRLAKFHYYLGYAQVKNGDTWAGLAGYERAFELSREPRYWLPLASLYLQLGLNAHALNAFRQVLKYGVETPDRDQLRQGVASLEADVGEAANQLKLPVHKMEQGLRYLEEGQRALHRGDFRECIAHNRRAIQLLGNWPPSHNNLALALFFDGQPQQAIATARYVLAQGPDNLQALSNAIRFLTWTGQEKEARVLWPQLQQITPQNHSDRLKMVEAAAILAEDESVYELLKPLDEGGALLVEAIPEDNRQTQLFLAIAEANTNRRKAALKRLRALKPLIPWAGELLAALQAGQPGPGWARRYPYFHSSELIPRRSIEAWLESLGQKDRMPLNKFQRQAADFAARYPQVVLVAEKLIIEENQPEAGIMLLISLGTPEAYATLRRFGLSQIGNQDVRMQALFRLNEAGQITPDEKLQIWNGSDWQEVQLRQYEITDEPEIVYSPQVAQLINSGMEALQRNNEKRAEELLQQAITLEPRAKEAYNNLGVIYGRREDHERAKEVYRKAIEIDPLYVFPRANLALYLLYEDDLAGAEQMLAPLAAATRFTPQEMAFYAYIQAQVAMEKEEYEVARNHLEMALEIIPDYEPAQKLLERVDYASTLLTGWERFQKQQQQRDQNARARLQTKLTTLEPALAEALALYSKDVLVAMARKVIRWGGWSGLRKAELLERLIEELCDRHNLERVVRDLNDTEREALRQVLAGGGFMDWSEFTARYDNDLEESPYWQYHVPESAMGRLRSRGLLAEATVDQHLFVVIPPELRHALAEVLA